MKNFRGYINGEFISTENLVEIINPKDNSVAGTVAAMSAEDIKKAFRAAREAFPSFRKTSKEERVA
ncbi:MAG: hypothetical protein DSZ21_01630 [Tenericutes bacterium]|nr:MAG: hypothetical protein DSZ21_01630 [Mycoplasmatota bacterium]